MVVLKKLTNKDVPTVKGWLKEPHVAKWFQSYDAWINEIELRETKYSFIRHFILWNDDQPIGFCQYYDYAKGGENWNGNIPVEGSYSIDYFIGCSDYLGVGLGKKIIELLIDEIRNTDAVRIIVQPDAENMISRKTLKSAGFGYDSSNDVYYNNINR